MAQAGADLPVPELLERVLDRSGMESPTRPSDDRGTRPPGEPDGARRRRPGVRRDRGRRRACPTFLQGISLVSDQDADRGGARSRDPDDALTRRGLGSAPCADQDGGGASCRGSLEEQGWEERRLFYDRGGLRPERLLVTSPSLHVLGCARQPAEPVHRQARGENEHRRHALAGPRPLDPSRPGGGRVLSAGDTVRHGTLGEGRPADRAGQHGDRPLRRRRRGGASCSSTRPSTIA